MIKANAEANGSMTLKDYQQALAWLKKNPSLDDLCAKYPDAWATVQQDISAIVQRGKAEELKHYLENISLPGKNKPINHQTALIQWVCSRMAHESVKRLCLATLAADTGLSKGRLRFNLFNGFIAQKLLFSKGLIRKPASLFWFRLFWPLVWQKKRLMPLVQPKGIYCFYTRELIDELVTMIGTRTCLEIGAGDGTLTRFLKDREVKITATDNHGWQNIIQYPEWVLKLEAREALKTYAPEVVLCSWPPSQNDFERHVYTTPSVMLYIVIGSRHRFAFGNWKDYQLQTTFQLETNQHLSALLLPPELESAVHIFTRKTTSLCHPSLNTVC